MKRRRFTQRQPKDGETIMHCGHIDSPPHHFFGFSKATRFKRLDGSIGWSRWIVVCQTCFNEAKGAPDRVASRVRGDGVWQGDEPAIETMPETN